MHIKTKNKKEAKWTSIEAQTFQNRSANCFIVQHPSDFHGYGKLRLAIVASHAVDGFHRIFARSECKCEFR